jgi:hypothetical protein
VLLQAIITVGTTLLTEIITVSNILYPLSAVTSYSNSRKNFIDRGYQSSNILYALAAITMLLTVITSVNKVLPTVIMTCNSC